MLASLASILTLRTGTVAVGEVVWSVRRLEAVLLPFFAGMKAETTAGLLYAAALEQLITICHIQLRVVAAGVDSCSLHRAAGLRGGGGGRGGEGAG